MLATGTGPVLGSEDGRCFAHDPQRKMQHFGRAVLRGTKNLTKGYSDTQVRVREATSNDPWGPTGTQMNEISQLTYNQNNFLEVIEMINERLNDKAKNWRHVFKSLTVLDYLLHRGSVNVVIYFRDNIYIIKTLKEFQFVDEEGKDQGANVRQKAKDITNLLQDEDRLRKERRDLSQVLDDEKIREDVNTKQELLTPPLSSHSIAEPRPVLPQGGFDDDCDVHINDDSPSTRSPSRRHPRSRRSSSSRGREISPHPRPAQSQPLITSSSRGREISPRPAQSQPLITSSSRGREISPHPRPAQSQPLITLSKKAKSRQSHDIIFFTNARLGADCQTYANQPDLVVAQVVRMTRSVFP